AQDDRFHSSPAINQQTYLSVKFYGKLGYTMGQFGRNDLGRLDVPPVKGFKFFYLIGLEACAVSKNAVNGQVL
ncbi:MAG: hypothetical protein AB1585_01670, partial [Thermodesulfobacteriota bacterium]